MLPKVCRSATLLPSSWVCAQRGPLARAGVVSHLQIGHCVRACRATGVSSRLCRWSGCRSRSALVTAFLSFDQFIALRALFVSSSVLLTARRNAPCFFVGSALSLSSFIAQLVATRRVSSSAQRCRSLLSSHSSAQRAVPRPRLSRACLVLGSARARVQLSAARAPAFSYTADDRRRRARAAAAVAARHRRRSRPH